MNHKKKKDRNVSKDLNGGLIGDIGEWRKEGRGKRTQKAVHRYEAVREHFTNKEF